MSNEQTRTGGLRVGPHAPVIRSYPSSIGEEFGYTEFRCCDEMLASWPMRAKIARVLDQEVQFPSWELFEPKEAQIYQVWADHILADTRLPEQVRVPIVIYLRSEALIVKSGGTSDPEAFLALCDDLIDATNYYAGATDSPR